jgi:DNA-binding PadR family transcriptional regulator
LNTAERPSAARRSCATPLPDADRRARRRLTEFDPETTNAASEVAVGKSALQHFELHVLLAMLRMGGEAYSVPLVLALEKRTRRPIAQAAVFIALGRLEKKGLVASRLDEPASGRTRRYFRLTKQGLAAVREQRVEHERLWRGLGRLLRAPRG